MSVVGDQTGEGRLKDQDSGRAGLNPSQRCPFTGTAEDALQEHPQSSRRVYMPGVMQAATATAIPRGRNIIQKEASGSTLVTPRVSRERPLQPRDSSSPLLPGTAPMLVPTVPSSILMPSSPRLIASTPPNPSTRGPPSQGPSAPSAPSQSKASRLWEPAQSQRQLRESSHLVLGHDANPFLQNGPALSRIPPDTRAFTDAAPQLYS